MKSHGGLAEWNCNKFPEWINARLLLHFARNPKGGKGTQIERKRERRNARAIFQYKFYELTKKERVLPIIAGDSAAYETR